jgi:hypothetical protein
LLIGTPLRAELLSIFVRHTVPISEQSHRPTDIQVRTKAFGEPLGGIDALPFTVHLEHGFFNYQPNLFDALARYNSYQTLGTWVGPDWSLSSLVPWEPKLLEFLTLNAKTTHLLVVLQRKLHDTEFCVPIQGVYEPMLPESATDRYQLVVDGEYYSVRRAQQVTKEVSYANLNEMPAVDIAKYLGNRVVRHLKRSFGH